ncbi:MAG: hypothetical protein O3A36_02435 [bacterium]|nr:hypothetical protein [bacterium]
MAPELFARIDQVIVFSPLSAQDMEKITKNHIRELQKLLVKKDIELQVSKGVITEIGERAFKEGKGARPIRRIVQDLLEDPIAHSIINKEYSKGQVLNAKKSGAEITIEHVQKEPASA